MKIKGPVAAGKTIKWGGEYKRHNFPKGRLMKESLKTDFVAFVFLFGLAVISGYLFLKLGG